MCTDGNALILGKRTLALSFRNVSVVGRSETLEGAIDCGKAKWNPETRMYRYEPSTNMPVDFTREELTCYLRDGRRIVDVSVEVGIHVMVEKEQKIGTAILTNV